MSDQSIPIITIDGLGCTGKGTIGKLLAKQLSWHFLDSGKIYRALAVSALWQNINSSYIPELIKSAQNLQLEFKENGVYLQGKRINEILNSEVCGNLASIISTIPQVREELLQRQRNFAQLPGLVADGRDMGTIVFPNAQLKLFFTANIEIRAERRALQLKKQGKNDNLDDILRIMQERDARDKNRAIAPSVPAIDAITIDTSDATEDEVLQQVQDLLHKL